MQTFVYLHPGENNIGFYRPFSPMAGASSLLSVTADDSNYPSLPSQDDRMRSHDDEMIMWGYR